MNLLVISRAPWNNNNAIGNTFTDFFSDLKDVNIFSLCMREANHVSFISKENFYFSEKQFVDRILKRDPRVGKYSKQDLQEEERSKSEQSRSGCKKTNQMIYCYAREFLWGLGLWKNSALDEFLQRVSPDVVFFPDFPCWYAHKVFAYIMEKTNAKGIIYHADDCYTLKQFSLSPLYWVYRMVQRKWVRNSVRLCQKHYVISDVQKKDYDAAFGVCNKVLTKCSDFDQEIPAKVTCNSPLKLVYTGGIAINRWKSLALIAKGLQIVNRDNTKAELIIYTGTVVTPEMDAALNIPGTSSIHGSVSAAEIPQIQEEADILVHVESFDLKSRLVVRQSFSTKIVDYLKRGRAIIAVGPAEVASIKHLVENNCAMYAENEGQVRKIIEGILMEPSQLSVVAQNAYICGQKFHNKNDMLDMLYNDIKMLAAKGQE